MKRNAKREKGFFASNKPENHTSEGKGRGRQEERDERKKGDEEKVMVAP